MSAGASPKPSSDKKSELRVEQRAAPGVKTFVRIVDWITNEKFELINVTDRINEIVGKSEVQNGVVHLQSLHTTAAVFINEWQDALLHDIRTLLEQAVGREGGWRHDAPAYSDCERKNAASHLRGLFLRTVRVAASPECQSPARHLAEYHPGGARWSPQPLGVGASDGGLKPAVMPRLEAGIDYHT